MGARNAPEFPTQLRAASYDNSSMNIETRDVLGGAYKGKQETRAMLTHSLEQGAAKTLCGSLAEERLADAEAGNPAARPTCPRCLKKDPRFA